jgi:hypothetical protein
MDTKDIVDIISKIITVLATIGAAGWAFYRFVKGRVFKPRLTLTVSARRLRMKGTEYVLYIVELSNVGLSRIDIDSADLRICSLTGKADAELVGVPQRDSLGTCQVLLAHSYVESGEVLREENLLILPVDQSFPILLDFRVVARGESFTATAIAQPSDTEASTAGKRNSP